MVNIPPKIQDENKLVVTAAPTTCSTGKLIRAKEFLACFRQDPDDLHLMRKFSLSPKQLRRVYEALIEKGLLTEFEYNHRGIASDGSESLISGPNPKTDDESDREGRSSEIRGMEPLRGQIHESRELISNSAVKIDSLSRGQTSCHQKHRTILFDRPGKRPLERPGFCPKCRQVTNPCSPDTCISCGVVFSKFRQTAKGQEVSIWEPDSRYR